jgi:hypothetical protein
MTPALELVATHRTAVTYHFRSPDRFGGYALCTVNDKTGELLIVSDWGNWSHSWYPHHLGQPSLTHFLATRSDGDYLACKLLGRAGAQALDADATIKAWRKTLCESRLESGRGERGGGQLTAGDARDIWDDIGELREYEDNESIFFERAYQIDGFDKWVSERPWEDAEHRPSHEYRALVDIVLPALMKACADTVSTLANTEAA